MSRSPSDHERDQSLERLAEAFASGRLTHAEFAERTDKVFSAPSISVLDSLLADLNEPGKSEIYGVAPRPYQPMPVRRPNVANSPGLSRRSLIGVGAFAAVATLIGISANFPNSPDQPVDSMVADEYPPVPMEPQSFLSPDAVYTMFDRLWETSIASIVFTPARALAICKPRGEGWQQLTLYEGGERLEPAEPGTNVFDPQEVSVEVINEALAVSADRLGTSKGVSRLEVVRLNPNEPVRLKVIVEGAGYVLWDAFNPTVIEVKKAG